MSTVQIEDIKQKIDIVEVIRKKVPDLKKSGRNWKGLCPFHNEKSPSFMVNPDLGIFKCFGCNEGGDVISFIEKTERVDFKEALRMAADMAGIELKVTESKADIHKKEVMKRLKSANELSAKYFNFLLTKHPSGKQALAYARKRGMTDEVIEKFLLGYAPNGTNLSKFLKSRGFTDEELVHNGFSVSRGTKLIDKFRDRLMFPIFNLKGEIVAFSGRTLLADGQPKYLNSPETEVYKKSDLPYGFYQSKDAIRKSGFAIFFEGNVDIVNSHRLGVENVACPLGTAVTPEQLKMTKRYAESVYFCFDTDNAGYKALLRGIELSETLELKHKVIDIGKYHDADELMMAEPSAWPQAVAAARNSLEYVLSQLDKKYDLATADGKIGFRDEVIQVLRLIKDQVELSHFVSKTAKILNVSEDVIRSQVSNLQSQHTYENTHAETAKPEVKSEDVIKVSKREVLLLALLAQLTKPLEFPIIVDIFTSDLTRDIFNKFMQYKGEPINFGEVAKELSPTGQQLLEQIVIYNLPFLTHPEAEILKVYRQIYAGKLRKQILFLRTQLSSFPDDQDTIAQFDYLTKELQNLATHKDNWPQLIDVEREDD